MKALSVRQPWAWAILHAGKDVENRDWPERYPARRFRGRILLHASKGCTRREFGDACAWIHETFGVEVPELESLPRGAIVGAVTVADIVDHSPSEWYVGAEAALLLRDPVALNAPIVCPGALGFFDVPHEVAAEVRRRAA